MSDYHHLQEENEEQLLDGHRFPFGMMKIFWLHYNMNALNATEFFAFKCYVNFALHEFCLNLFKMKEKKGKEGKKGEVGGHARLKIEGAPCVEGCVFAVGQIDP